MSNPTEDEATNGTETAVKSEKPAAETNGTAVTSKTEGAAMNGIVMKDETKSVDSADEPDGSPPDEEEKMFLTLEEEQEKEDLEEKLHPHSQPKAVEAAPTLLRAALKKGQVKADDSEEESDKEKAEAPAANAEEEPHYHARGNQLDFLLSKASEYSNFISKDLDELQASMADDAQRAQSKAEKKKRKAKKKAGGASKKQKTSSLESAQAADAETRKEKAIFVQPPNLAADCFLKDYQLEGVRWLASLFENGVSGILADEMGLGKTIQCVALIAHLLTKGVSGPFIIVAPLATLPNWVREFEKWLPTHPVIRYHGSAGERDAMLRGPLLAKHKKNDDFPFIVTSYEMAIRDQTKLEKLSEYTYLIVDEGMKKLNCPELGDIRGPKKVSVTGASGDPSLSTGLPVRWHRLKNHRCTLLSSLKKLKAANRLLLTGTPIQNTLNELWSLLNFVNPTIFDDLSVFQSWFGFRDIGQNIAGATTEEAVLVEERKNQTVTKLHEILRPFLLRRIKLDVLSEMPPKREVIVYSGISKLQAGYADLIDKGTLRDTLIDQGIEDGRTLSQFNKLMNHRKNINHPFLFGEPIDPATGVHLGTAHPQLLVRASGKFALLDRMLSRLFQDGHQVLIFSQMTKVLNVMEDYLNFRKWKYCRIDGSTHIDERQRQMDAFNAEKTSGLDGTRNQAADRNFVFLLSTRAGGLGINLTAADTCIIFDSDWNPFVDNQAMDRCHRLGQTLPVAVYRLITVNSVDIDMMEKQVSKKKLERMTIAGGDFRKAGRRSRGDINAEKLSSLLQSDIKDMNAKGGDVEDIKIDEEEFDKIMDRKRLFATGEDAVPTEGKMYDLIDAATGDLLGDMS